MAATKDDFSIPLELDEDNYEADSTYQATTVNSDLTSISSSVVQYVYENGRRYASERTAANYYLPNDEIEQERLDLAHHGWNLGLKGELHLAKLPKDRPIKVLDLGTGTGIVSVPSQLGCSARCISGCIPRIFVDWKDFGLTLGCVGL